MAGVNPVTGAAVAAAVEPVGDARQQAFQRALSGQLGKSLQGQILGRLADGSFVVRVDGQAARMLLPPGAQVGADIPLKLVALEPRPTFELADGARAFAQAMPGGAAAAYLGNAGAAGTRQVAMAELPLPTPAAARAGGDAATATLSPTGRMLGSVLAAALKAEPGPAAVTGRVALLGAPSADSAQLAGALARGIGTSGLFYESHLAEWAQGQRSLAQLAAEPQMAGPRPGQPESDPASAQFVSQQLATQEQGRVAWQGQLWPGQPLALELAREQVERDAPEQRPDGAAPEPAWQGSLRVRFPVLGELAARLTLAGGQLHLRLDAASGPAGELLKKRVPQLAAALDAAGTPLASFAVREPEPRDD